jgi:hypothetical protein
MALALAPLAGMALEPAIASILGPAVAKNLSPLAMKGVEKLIKSKVAGKAVHKIGNALFGKKHKTARKLMKKGRSIAGVAFGKNSKNILGKGLDLAGDLGMLDEGQREAIKTGHAKAMSIHDQLSELNRPDKSSKMNYNDMDKDSEFDGDTGSGPWVAIYGSPGGRWRHKSETKNGGLDYLSKTLSNDLVKPLVEEDSNPDTLREISEYVIGNKLKKGLSLEKMKSISDEIWPGAIDLELYKVGE